ncbi:hypothetical protein D3Z39_06215 [Anaerotruncus colihominis]|uniref:Uncharacterized protein n=1 Tax=Anaerotruncus colihominis TaxID=169435 RepID=A0A845RHR8_9FIRM|nr:hypothetical protein [Anaerotruncus colihominis]
MIIRPRAGDGADGQFFIDCKVQSIKNSCNKNDMGTLSRKYKTKRGCIKGDFTQKVKSPR